MQKKPLMCFLFRATACFEPVALTEAFGDIGLSPTMYHKNSLNREAPD